MLIKNVPDEIESYLSDAANFKGKCNSVFIPENEVELIEIVRRANSESFRVTVSGNGTGLTGGRVPLEGSVLSTEKLNNIVEINASNMTAKVQPGVLLSDFQNEINNRGLYYPPDPTETNCFIGATIALNSSGAKSFKYGATRNFVNAVRIVLPDGGTLSLRRGEVFARNYKLKITAESGGEKIIELPDYKMPKVKNAAGYFTGKEIDAVDLFIGAEGTLGVITEAELRLLNKPAEVLSAVVFFPEVPGAINFIRRAARLSRAHEETIDALGLEFFDGAALNFLKADFPGIPQCAAAVWFEQELKDDEEQIINVWSDLILEFGGDEENSWIAINAKEREKFKNFRHAISYKVSEYIAGKNLTKVGTDTAVPESEFIDFYYEAEKIVNDGGIEHLNYGHFGDCHMHLNMLPGDEREFKTAKELYREICKLAVNKGGTVSAEHGIGKLKKEYLLLMYGERNIRQMASVKKTLDPNLILNIGNIFDEKYFD